MGSILQSFGVKTPRGNDAEYAVRHDTNDAALVYGIVTEDEYRLKDLPPLQGWALDIGAHIGAVAIALAVDNPDLTVVAVEALAENVEVMNTSIRQNGLEGRISVIHAAATCEEKDGQPIEIVYGWSKAENQPDDYMQQSRFIGGMVGPNETSKVETVDGISLSAIMGLVSPLFPKRQGYGPPSLVKIDCEGCEWDFLSSPRVSELPLILGEYHDDPQFPGVVKMLPDHDVTHLSGTNVGHFRAVLR